MTVSDRALAERIAALDTTLFDPIPGLASLDRRALLALHAATAETFGEFTYLEVGSYLGGSLQALVRDPRCVGVVSIDPRLEHVRDVRPGGVSYSANSTANMLTLLGDLAGADVGKIWSAETTTAALRPGELPHCPRLCFVDGEHTDAAVLQDAHFCREAMNGAGVVAFHDAALVKGGIRAFLRDAWPEIRFGLRFGDQVFAVEFGEERILQRTVVRIAVDSAWHTVAWRLGNSGPSSRALISVWRAVERLDLLAVAVRRRLNR